MILITMKSTKDNTHKSVCPVLTPNPIAYPNHAQDEKYKEFIICALFILINLKCNAYVQLTQ